MRFGRLGPLGERLVRLTLIPGLRARLGPALPTRSSAVRTASTLLTFETRTTLVATETAAAILTFATASSRLFTGCTATVLTQRTTGALIATETTTAFFAFAAPTPGVLSRCAAAFRAPGAAGTLITAEAVTAFFAVATAAPCLPSRRPTALRARRVIGALVTTETATAFLGGAAGALLPSPAVTILLIRRTTPIFLLVEPATAFAPRRAAALVVTRETLAVVALATVTRLPPATRRAFSAPVVITSRPRALAPGGIALPRRGITATGKATLPRALLPLATSFLPRPLAGRCIRIPRTAETRPFFIRLLTLAPTTGAEAATAFGWRGIAARAIGAETLAPLTAMAPILALIATTALIRARGTTRSAEVALRITPGATRAFTTGCGTITTARPTPAGIGIREIASPARLRLAPLVLASTLGPALVARGRGAPTGRLVASGPGLRGRGAVVGFRRVSGRLADLERTGNAGRHRLGWITAYGCHGEPRRAGRRGGKKRPQLCALGLLAANETVTPARKNGEPAGSPFQFAAVPR
ncbi:hypothetical protein [Azoarcus sp. TTM-91]|uniref:hypothetical protein n=1 Tax=Azoarcus sp. TTM-91 TaxID=2691581 RepID=UPI002006E4B4|nr:hypothetical protein [Azoarcus sp. TTM-91]